MIKICSLGLVFMSVPIMLFQKRTNRNGEETTAEVLNASSTEECEFNIKSVRNQEENRSLQSENRNNSLENIQYNESNERSSDFNVQERNCETVHDVLLNKTTSLVEKANAGSNVADRKVMIEFDEKAREDGFKRTTPEEAPYAVVVRVLSGRLPMGVCSGSLITARWVITAAHCFKMDYDKVIVYAGGNSVSELDDGTEPEGSAWQSQQEVYTHPMYRPNKKAHFDIALVQVANDFEMTKTVNKVKLSLKFWKHKTYQDCQVTGFGRVNLVGQSDLDNTRKSHFLRVNNDCECIHMSKLVMCSEPKEDYGICSGDSGGGLICDGKLVALAVGMLAFKNLDTCTLLDRHVTQECGVRNSLNVFQQVCPYIQWLSTHVTSINLTNVDVHCYDPAQPEDYDEDSEHWGDDYNSVDYEDGGNFDTITRTSNLLLLTCSLVLLVNRAKV